MAITYSFADEDHSMMCVAMGANARMDDGQMGPSADCTAKYVPAPEDNGDGIKLLLVGNVCFNKQMKKLPRRAATSYEKPAGLSKLSDALFYSFTKDLQLSLHGHWTSCWRTLLLCALIILAASASSAIFSSVPGIYLIYCDAAYLFCAIILALGNHKQFGDLCTEVELRTQEWEPLFESEGFSVQCIVDKNCWRPSKLYIHIKQSSATRKDKLLSEMRSCGVEPEVKYIVLFARLFARRNKTCRVILTSKALSSGNYVKPPALQDLSDAVFQSLMKDMDKKVRAFTFKKRNICCSLFLLELTVLLCWTPVGIFLPVTIGSIFSFLIVDQFVLDHFLFPKSGISKFIKKWAPRLNAHGFTLEYCMDKPKWYSWKEGLIHIRSRGFEV